MSESIEADDAAYLPEGGSDTCIVIPGYRGCYAPNDFTDLESRSLDNAVASYLSKSTIRYWWNPQKRLLLKIPAHERDPQRELTTVKAYHEMFAWRSKAVVHKFVMQLPLVLTLVAVGITILWISHQVDDTNIEKDVRSTLSGVVQVGAWVALWSAITLLFASGFEALAGYVAFRRLARIPIEFEYGAGADSRGEASRTTRKTA